MQVKFLDVNKNIINAIFMINGDSTTIEKELDNILEKEGKIVKPKQSRKTKKEKAIESIISNVAATPGRRVKRSLFKNR